jgi:predicted nucleotidyltransferase
MGQATTKTVILELKNLKKKFKVEKMLLFGSRARGEELLSSDVDVLIISKKFIKIPFKQRPDEFLEAWKLPLDLEIICYTPEEFERKKKELGLVQTAVKEGKEIK